jgi:antirestriction protein ArdC
MFRSLIEANQSFVERQHRFSGQHYSSLSSTLTLPTQELPMSRAYDQIAATLLSMTDEAGSWRPCWHNAGLVTPANAATGRTYQGSNVLSLWAAQLTHKYERTLWASYRQWLTLGAQVRGDEKGHPIVFFGTHTSENDAGEKKSYRLAKGSVVFNVAQVDGYDPDARVERNPDDKIADAELFALRSGATIYCGPEIDPPHFNPVIDRVAMPPFASFKSAEAYYAVLMHELTHWTGSRKRLARESLIHYDRHRALEELVAELGAAFLCADLGLSAEPRADHAAYLKSWYSTLKNDPAAFMRAVSAASSAALYLHSCQEDARAAA